MAHPPNQKAESRARIVREARKLFNHHGFSSVSIDEIMTAAGLTRGGFYNHFQTKDELYLETLADFARCREQDYNDSDNADTSIAEQVLNTYLSRHHRENIESQCPLIALPGDVARGGPELRTAYEQIFRAMARVFEAGMKDSPNASARDQSLVTAATCVGAMIIARTINSSELAEELCRATRKSLTP